MSNKHKLYKNTFHGYKKTIEKLNSQSFVNDVENLQKEFEEMQKLSKEEIKKINQETNMSTTCQICEREIKSKNGVIAHHGYKRPGGGWQTASCYGARHVPYEKGNDAIPYAIQQIKNYIKTKEEYLVKIQNKEISFMYARFEIKPEDSMYEYKSKVIISNINYEIKLCNHDIERLQKRFDEWTK